jgi:DNA-binding CsgD family transcriptional regulator
MCLANNEPNLNITSSETHEFKLQNSKTQKWQPELHSYLLQTVIESFVDGILILTAKGEVLHINEYARQICYNINPGKGSSQSALPEEIKRVCKSLIESRELFPEEKIFVESEILLKESVEILIRARWLELSNREQNFLLVTLENRNQTNLSMALADAKKYGLTEREVEVWLLRKANLSYREIANRLYITINTVKKHVKSIYAKQQRMLWS